MAQKFACDCHSNMDQHDSRYNVNVLDRIKDLMGEFTEISENTILKYEFSLGYERLEIHELGHGKMSYNGTYHPDTVCVSSGGEGKPGICVYCGSTLW